MDYAALSEAFADDLTPLIRTDFTDDAAWESVVRTVTQPGIDLPGEPGADDYEPGIEPLSDRGADGLTPDQLAAAFHASDEDFGYVVLADARSMTEAREGRPLTVVYVDLATYDGSPGNARESYVGNYFRCLADVVAGVEANLALDNMAFWEFAERTDPDGVFRGFPRKAREGGPA